MSEFPKQHLHEIDIDRMTEHRHPPQHNRTLFHIMVLLLLFVSSCSREEKPGTSLDGTWFFKADSLNQGVDEQWYRAGFDKTTWTKIAVPEYWDRYNLETYDGAGWYATSISVDDTSQHPVLYFAGVDDDAEIWLDGVKIGSHVGYSEPFTVELPGPLSPGKKELVVRVDDHSGPGGIYRSVRIVPRDRIVEMYKTEFSDVVARPSEEWVRDAVIYEVYLRSFSKEGTLKGLENRLPELKKLGVTILWLMPIHPVGELNRKGRLGSPYAVQDYYAVNPEFGTIDDFKSLVAAVHRQGMKIIIDLVANHTAWDSKLVMEHPEWFTTNEEGAIVSPNADWSDVADLNYGYHELRKYMIGMMEYWVGEVGIDGFRCDVAELVPTDFWNRARKELDKIKPVIMLSEGTLPEHHVEAFDLTYSWTLYDVFSPVIDGTVPVAVFDNIQKVETVQFPNGSLRLRFNTNHDKNAWDAPAVTKFTPQGAKATAVLAFTFPGVPLLYNGEEVGNDKKLSLFEKVSIDWGKNPQFRAFYELLTQLRAAHPALRSGQHIAVPNSDGKRVYSFLRRAGEDEVLVVVNFSKERKSVVVELADVRGNSFNEYFSGTVVQPTGRRLSLDLGGLEYRVFVPSSDRPGGNQ